MIRRIAIEEEKARPSRDPFVSKIVKIITRFKKTYERFRETLLISKKVPKQQLSISKVAPTVELYNRGEKCEAIKRRTVDRTRPFIDIDEIAG